MAHDRKDFLSSTDPKWCPGCGNYGVLKALTTVFADMGLAKEKYLVVSGIGCSSRLPYYADTYGVHSIHGRAPTFALGAKLTHPELSLWIISGDGDSLSIGTNHFIHLARRNPDINFLLFNNMIYGLTKGQASPTSPQGLETKSTPDGAVDRPLSALKVAHAAGASFLARVTDSQPQFLKDTLRKAAEHKGTSVVEVLVNCIIFNDGVFKNVSQKSTREDTTITLQEGEALRFGQSREKYLALNGLKPEVRRQGEEANMPPLIHHLGNDQGLYSQLLLDMYYPEFPLPLGILHQSQRPVYEDVAGQGLKTLDDWDEQDLVDLMG